MAKQTEESLRLAWIDIKFTEMFYEDYISDMVMTLKEARRTKRKITKTLKRISDKNKELYGGDDLTLPKKYGK